MKYKLSVLCLILYFAGCSFFNKKEIEPFKSGQIPYSYSIQNSIKKPETSWWLSFQNNELNKFIDNALTNNFSLESSWARLMQAKAQVIAAGSSQYPDLNLKFNPMISKKKDQVNGTGSWINDISLGLMSSFEIDFWGKIKAKKKAANFELNAASMDYNTAVISLISEVVLCWIDIISEKMKKELLDEQLKTNQTYLKLIQIRFQKGLASSIDIYQQQQVVESILSQMPLVEANERFNLNHINILCGKPPQSSVSINTKKLPKLQGIPLSGLPSDLLKNRPDIKAAWNRLQAANENLWSTKADQLPSLTLTGYGSFQSDSFSNLFESWLLRLSSDLTAPIFDGSRRKAETYKASAKLNEQLMQYKNIVYNALNEVENALISIKQQEIHVSALKQERNTAQIALDEAINRYEKGLIDYLPVLTQILSVQKLEREIIIQETQYLHYRVQLCRSLGSGLTFDKPFHYKKLKE